MTQSGKIFEQLPIQALKKAAEQAGDACGGSVAEQPDLLATIGALMKARLHLGHRKQEQKLSFASF